MVNPVAYGVAALRHFLSPQSVTAGPGLVLCLIVMIAFGAVTLAAAFLQAHRPSAQTLS